MTKPSSSKSTSRLCLAFAFSAVLLSAGCANNEKGEISSQLLLDKTNVTVLGKNFNYPVTNNPEVTSSVITLPPGVETGLHLHEAPMYAYILEGTVDVTYSVNGVDETKTYKKGEAIMEGLDTPHNGVNNTNSVVRILVVNIGSPDLMNTVKLN